MNKSIFSDRELLKQLSKDNTEAFKVLFDHYYPVLVRVLMRYSSDQEQIKDWIQEIYIRLWETREGINADYIENFKAYFIVTARNYAIKELSKKRHLKPEQFQSKTQEEIADSSSYNFMEENELRQAYQMAVSRLPVKTQKAYVLNRETGLTYRGVAKELGISIKTVENQIGKALKILRIELADYLPGMLWPVYFIVEQLTRS